MKFKCTRLARILFVGMMVLPILGVEKSNGQVPGNKPNIIVIIPDDMGWSDVGYYGSDIKTPHIDQLAASGVRMNQHYVMPTCTPTRVSLMTGKYPSRYGITGPAYGEVIDLGDPTLASVLKENGYFTAIAGKWHMGSPPYTPLKYGFQSSYGYFDGQIDPYTHEYKKETALTDRRSWHRNDVYLDEEGHVTDLLTTEAIRIIEEKREEPFFLYLAHHVPHFPLDEPEAWLNRYNDRDMFPSRKLFAASVTHMDDAIGKIIDALERTGQRGNTLILFTSDNGGQHSWHSATEYRGKYANKPHDVLGNNYPLRGWKGELYEGGIRVPAFVNWPGRLEPGRSDFPVHISDWFPTFCELIGIETPANQILDGQSIWPLLVNQEKVPGNRPIYWKIKSHYAIREGDWKLLINRHTNLVELYNLKHDFRETRNLSDTKPEKVAHMLKLLEAFKEGD